MTEQHRPGVYDIASGERVPDVDFDIDHNTPVVVQDASRLIGAATGHVTIYDTRSWAPTYRWLAHENDAFTRSTALSADESTLVTTGSDGVLRVWDVSTALAHQGELLEKQPPLLDEFALGVISDVRWIDDSTLGLAYRNGEWDTITLDSSVLLSVVAASITRDMTARECQTYRIDPCPTLEELRNRWSVPHCEIDSIFPRWAVEIGHKMHGK